MHVHVSVSIYWPNSPTIPYLLYILYHCVECVPCVCGLLGWMGLFCHHGVLCCVLFGISTATFSVHCCHFLHFLLLHWLPRWDLPLCLPPPILSMPSATSQTSCLLSPYIFFFCLDYCCSVYYYSLSILFIYNSLPGVLGICFGILLSSVWVPWTGIVARRGFDVLLHRHKSISGWLFRAFFGATGVYALIFAFAFSLLFHTFSLFYSCHFAVAMAFTCVWQNIISCFVGTVCCTIDICFCLLPQTNSIHILAALWHFCVVHLHTCLFLTLYNVYFLYIFFCVSDFSVLWRLLNNSHSLCTSILIPISMNHICLWFHHTFDLFPSSYIRRTFYCILFYIMGTFSIHILGHVAWRRWMDFGLILHVFCTFLAAALAFPQFGRATFCRTASFSHCCLPLCLWRCLFLACLCSTVLRILDFVGWMLFVRFYRSPLWLCMTVLHVRLLWPPYFYPFHETWWLLLFSSLPLVHVGPCTSLFYACLGGPYYTMLTCCISPILLLWWVTVHLHNSSAAICTYVLHFVLFLLYRLLVDTLVSAAPYFWDIILQPSPSSLTQHYHDCIFCAVRTFCVSDRFCVDILRTLTFSRHFPSHDVSSLIWFWDSPSSCCGAGVFLTFVCIVLVLCLALLCSSLRVSITIALPTKRR